MQPFALCALREGRPFVQCMPMPHGPPTTWQQLAKPSKRPVRSGFCLLCPSPAGSGRCKHSAQFVFASPPFPFSRMGVYQDASTDPWPTLKPLPGVSGSLNLNTTEGLYFLVRVPSVHSMLTSRAPGCTSVKSVHTSLSNKCDPLEHVLAATLPFPTLPNLTTNLNPGQLTAAGKLLE